MDAVGNHRAAALARLDEKAELAWAAWCEGYMPDDVYELRIRQVREQKARIVADLAHLERAKLGSGNDV